MILKNKKAGSMVSLFMVMMLVLAMLQGCGGKPA